MSLRNNNNDIKMTLSQLLLRFLVITSFAFFTLANLMPLPPAPPADAQPSSTQPSSTTSSSQNLSNNPGNSTDAQIAVNQNNVYVIWSDATTGNGDIYFKRSVDNGTTFDEIENLSTNKTGSAFFPQISTVGSNVYVAWIDTTTGNNEVIFRHSNNTGESFRGARELSKTLSVDGEHAMFPRVSAIGSNVYV